MNIFEKYKEYVVFTSLKKELSVFYFLYENNYVAVYSNRPDKLELVFDTRFLFQNCDAANKIIGKLIVCYEEHLFEKRYNYDTYRDGEFVLKSHPMYIEGITNSFFEIGDLEIHVFHYPREIVNVNNKKSLEFCSFVGTEDDIIRELLYGMKKILSRYNHFKGVFSIHGAALSNNKKGYLFLSGSRAGKSTLFVNLMLSGLIPINDDIVFWSLNDHKEVVISGCATLPQLRKGTFDTVVPIQSMQCHNLHSSHLCNEILSKVNNSYDKTAILQAIFIPELGYDTSTISEIKKIDVFKKELRACMVHGNYEIDERFLESIKSLNSLPTFKLCMSKNYNEVCQVLNDFLGDYS